MQEKNITLQIKKIDILIFRKIISNYKDVKNMSPIQIGILMYLIKNENVYQKDLEKNFDVRRSTISGILKTMEKNDLIKKEGSNLDARSKRIILTNKSIKLSNNILKNINEFETQIRKGITKEEIDIFFNIVDKIKSNLEG